MPHIKPQPLLISFPLAAYKNESALPIQGEGHVLRTDPKVWGMPHTNKASSHKLLVSLPLGRLGDILF